MPNRSSFTTRLSAALFIVGLILTTGISLAIFWPNLEASLFDTNTTAMADSPLRTLRCPSAITVQETGQIQATFTNSGERESTFVVRARFSQGLATLMREETEVVRLAPGAQRVMSWPVTADDAAYGRVIMARVYVTASTIAAARQGSCGILLVNAAGVTGQQLIIASILVSLLVLGTGGGLWLGQQRPLTGRASDLARAFGILTAIILGSLLAGLLGWWLASLLLVAGALLFIGVMLERFARH